MEETFYGKLIAMKNGIYTVYVFQTPTGEYKMCTKLPNWGPYNLSIEDSGYITVEYAKAGDLYYNRITESMQTYKYTNIYFKDFVPDIKSKEIIL